MLGHVDGCWTCFVVLSLNVLDLLKLTLIVLWSLLTTFKESKKEDAIQLLDGMEGIILYLSVEDMSYVCPACRPRGHDTIVVTMDIVIIVFSVVPSYL